MLSETVLVLVIESKGSAFPRIVPNGFGLGGDGIDDWSFARPVLLVDRNPGAAVYSRKLVNLTPGYARTLLRSSYSPGCAT